MSLSDNNHQSAAQAWLFLIACIIGLSFYYPTLADMAAMWWEESSAYSHGLLLVFVVAYFFTRQWFSERHRLSIQTKIWLLPPVLFLSLLWMLAYLAQVQALEQLVVLLVLGSLVVALLGPSRSVPYIYVIALMIFTISSWSQINDLLRFGTAILSGIVLELTGVTSVREGYFILVPAGTFEVTGGCSGLRYQLAGLSIAFIYAYMERMSLWMTFFYLLTAALVIFFANVVRIYIVILAGQFTQMKSSLVDDHLWLGWIVFGVFMSAFLYFSNRLIRPADRSAKDAESELAEPPVNTNGGKWGYTLLVLALVASGPLLAHYYTPSPNMQNLPTLELPGKAGDWALTPLSANGQDWKPAFISPDITSGGRYTDSGRHATAVDYYMMIYAYQTQGHEAVNVNNKVYDETSWVVTASRNQAVRLENDRSFVVREFEIRDRRGKTRLVWMWYYVNGENLSNKYKTKMAGLAGVFKKQPAISVNVLSVATGIEPGPARSILTDFLNHGLTGMNRLFDSWSS